MVVVSLSSWRQEEVALATIMGSLVVVLLPDQAGTRRVAATLPPDTTTTLTVAVAAARTLLLLKVMVGVVLVVVVGLAAMGSAHRIILREAVDVVVQWEGIVANSIIIIILGNSLILDF